MEKEDRYLGRLNRSFLLYKTRASGKSRRWIILHTLALAKTSIKLQEATQQAMQMQRSQPLKNAIVNH